MKDQNINICSVTIVFREIVEIKSGPAVLKSYQNKISYLASVMQSRKDFKYALKPFFLGTYHRNCYFTTYVVNVLFIYSK